MAARKPRVDFSRKRFLIIDDFSDMRSMLRHMVESFGATRIDVAGDAKEALKLMSRHSYDVVLCDYNLGEGKDGQQLLEEAKHRKLIRFSTVFMMLTAENTMQMVMGAVEYYPDDYLSKPFTKDTLRQRLERIILRKADLEEIEERVQHGELAEAIRLCDERIRDRPRNLREFQKLKGELCLRQGRYQEAEALYRDVIRERPMPWARLGLGKVFFHTGRLEAARNTFQELVEENEHFMEAYDWLAKTLERLGEEGEARRWLETAATLSPKAILRQMNLGDLALRCQDYATAARAFKKAVKLGEHSVYRTPANYSKQARALARSGSGTEALRVLGRLRRDFPDDQGARLYAELAESTVLQDLGRDEEAQEAYRRAARLFQEQQSRCPPALVLEMAKTSILHGDEQLGRELARELVRNHHEDEALLQQVQAAFAEIGRSEEGRELISDSRDNVVRLNNRGVRLVQEGQLEEAIRLFEAALEDLPHNKTINMNTAMVLLKYMERHGPTPEHLERVRRCLQMVRETAPQEPDLPALQARFDRLVNAHAA